MLHSARGKARQGRILYLKHSGERIGDLRSLPDDELHEWYTQVRRANEVRYKREREIAERLKRSRAARLRR